MWRLSRWAYCSGNSSDKSGAGGIIIREEEVMMETVQSCDLKKEEGVTHQRIWIAPRISGKRFSPQSLQEEPVLPVS